MPDDPRPTFVIELRSERGWENIPIATRLKRFLKLALRGFGLRCVSIVEAKPEEPAEK